MFREIKLALKEKAIVESDHGYSEEQIYNLCPEARHDLKDGRSMWRINQVCAKIRQNISRLRRRTWAVVRIGEGYKTILTFCLVDLTPCGVKPPLLTQRALFRH